MSNIVIGIDQGEYIPNVGTKTVTLSKLDFVPTVDALLYFFNTTQDVQYFAQAESFAKDITITADGDDWILEYQDLATFNTLGANDVLHIQFWYPVNPQYPLPTDGDSVYVKDLDLQYCDNGNFSGGVDDYFNSLKTVNSDSTSNNPKTIKIWFKRSTQIQSIGFGCDNLSESFSNIVVKALGSGEAVRYTDDRYEDDNTKRNSFLIELPPLALNGILLEFHTTDTICLSNLIIFKATDVNSRIKGVSELTENVESINSFRGALKVDTALVHKEGVNLFFFRETGVSSTLAVAASDGDTSITVASAVGFNTGDRLRLNSTIATGQPFLFITNIVGNVLTLDRPLIIDLDIGDAADIVTTSLNVNGTLALPVTFKIIPPNGTLSLIWQLTRIIINMTDATAMDDGKFGGITGGLTNGVVLRVVKGSGEIQELTNWKKNGDLALDMYDVTYVDDTLGPAGLYGLRGRWTFTKAEFIVELDGLNGDYFELLVQDDLTGLDSFEIKSQGRLFGG